MEREEAQRPEMPRDPAIVRVLKGYYTTWTNEKHNSYLDALEASFVDQLHNSLGLKKKRFSASLSRATLDDANYPSDQFAVLRGTFWWKKVFEKELTLEKLGNVDLMDSTEHYIFWNDQLKLREERLFTDELMSSEYPVVCHPDRDTVALSAEGSDQNFLDEDEEEKTARNS